jgi:chalcone isomerase-like protein
MRKLVTGLVAPVIIAASAITLLGATLAGVTLPDSATVAGKTLVLNGLGLRTKMVFKVYVAGLYLVQKSSDAAAIIKADAPKQVVMQFVRSVTKDQMIEAFDESFKNNAPEALTTMKADVDRLLGAFEPLKEGDQMVFTYVPATGTTLSIAGKDKVTIAGAPFAQALFSAWLGPKPPSADLKKGLLGG